jgi:hypothetical protein
MLLSAAASREYGKRFPERHHPGPRQLLISYSGEIDRTGLKILENEKNIQLPHCSLSCETRMRSGRNLGHN